MRAKAEVEKDVLILHIGALDDEAREALRCIKNITGVPVEICRLSVEKL